MGWYVIVEDTVGKSIAAITESDCHGPFDYRFTVVVTSLHDRVGGRVIIIRWTDPPCFITAPR